MWKVGCCLFIVCYVSDREVDTYAQLEVHIWFGIMGCGNTERSRARSAALCCGRCVARGSYSYNYRCKVRLKDSNDVVDAVCISSSDECKASTDYGVD